MPHEPSPPPGHERRTFLSRLSGLTMISGLAAGYGTFTHIAGRFLYPAKPPDRRWIFVTRVADLPRGGSLDFRAPGGTQIAVARNGEGEEDGFVALSSTCPHLGCRVHWQSAENRFFCPCHNGAFDRAGKATAGPPAEAGQSLSSYPLEVRNGLLYVQVTRETAEASHFDIPEAPAGPGQDPCLFQRPARGFGSGEGFPDRRASRDGEDV